MRKVLCCLTAIMISICVAHSVQAQKYDLGGDVAIKVEYIHFTDSIIRRIDANDGIFVGAEFYKELFCPNLFLGVESGWGGTSGSLVDQEDPLFTSDTSVDYVPIEFNAKYLIPITPDFDFHLGAGISYSYMNVELKASELGRSLKASDSNWLFGGQFFGGFTYKYRNWFAGIGAKYQLTQEERFRFIAFDPRLDVDIDGSFKASADNVRAGGQIGYRF